jgi:hypothetical protein
MTWHIRQSAGNGKFFGFVEKRNKEVFFVSLQPIFPDESGESQRNGIQAL